MAEHTLTVMVNDHGVPDKRNFARVIIYIQDANDHAPEWTEGILEATVLETSDKDTAIVTILASDKDHGINAELSYTILSGNTGNAFTIDPVFGTLHVNKELDSVKLSEYLITVKVADKGELALSTTVPVHVVVVTPDNSPPRFINRGMSVELQENQRSGSVVKHIEVISTSSLLFEIIAGNEENVFAINPATGTVTTKDELDYERTKTYDLTLMAMNMAGAKEECQLLIHVIDCNDNAPRFVRTRYSGIVAEDAAIGSLVLTNDSRPFVISAEDDDSQVNALLQFEISELYAQNMFFIDTFAGVVRTAAKLDYEMTPSVEFRVIAVDLGKPQQTSEVAAVVHIDVVDVNDCPPEFTLNEYNVDVLLPTYDNVRILQVEAKDEDSVEITTLQYSIMDGNLNNIYEIDPKTGIISIIHASKISRNSTPHRLRVSVSDGRHTSEAIVYVTWLYNSETSLIFQRAVYYGEVFENTTKATRIAVVNIVGSHLNEYIEYSILNPSSKFQIGLASGVISTIGVPFDRETEAYYHLIVQARSEDFHGSVRIAQVPVNITVLDVNDNCPVFLNKPYFGIVSIGAPKGDVITKVQAVDMDSGDNGVIRYELIKGHGELFQVDRKTGMISLKQTLDASHVEYQLSIAAYDGGIPPCSTEATIILKVVDHSVPLFEKQFYKALVPENLAVNTPLPVVINAHSTYGHLLIYSIIDGDVNQQFSVNFTTGSLSNNDPCILYIYEELDYETKSQYLLTLRATDSISKTYAEVPVNIIIIDVNDCIPKFSADFYNITVAENTPVGSYVLQVAATDNDTGIGGELYYSLDEDKDGIKLLSIGSEDGRIYLHHALDYEKRKQYSVSILVKDKGVPQQTASVPVLLNVLNINDNPPRFSQLIYTCWLSEEASQGQLVIAVTAYDPDVDQLFYKIVSGNEHHTFSIHKETGVLSVASLHYLNEETRHTVNISVSDGMHTSFAQIHIEMFSTNKHRPQFSQHQYNVRISENLPSGTAVTSVTAYDEDSGVNGRITYSIPSYLLQQTYHINSDTGEIWTTRRLDREKQASYDLPVLAADSSGKSDWTTVHVTVEDSNDNTPIFHLSEYKISIYSNISANSVFLKVTAGDQDTGDSSQIVYSIVEPQTSRTASLFGIKPNTGGLFIVQSALSYENKVYQFFVRASDCGAPSLHSDVPVLVYIMNKYEVPPVFHNKDEILFLPENVKPGKIVTKVKLMSDMAVDYKLLGGTSTFSINSAGEIRTLSNIDRETVGEYKLGVLALAHRNPHLVAFTEISLRILDVNDNLPRFHSENYTVTIAENVEETTSVYRVYAEDLDDGTNAEIHYTIVGDETAFMIDPYTGWITTLSSLDKETMPSCTLTVIATDSGSPSLTSTSHLHVNIIDYNDNPPTFSQESYITEVKEDAVLETVITQVLVTDRDVDATTNIAYYITDGDLYSQFAVLPTGHVYIVQPLDREVCQHYSLTIIATDSKFVTSAHLHIAVLDANDEKPVCLRRRYEHIIPESLPPDTYICTILATDADLQSKLKYYITGDGNEDFYIDQTTGELKAGKGLDREKYEHYALTVHVQDLEMPNWECISHVTITLTDINDNAPHFFRDKYVVNVHESAPVGTPVIKVQAVDSDTGINRGILYFLVDSGENHFDVFRESGLIYLVKQVDRESKAEYLLTIKAIDQGFPQLWSLVSIQVIVTDVNDNPPEFLYHFYNATVLENTTVGSEVIRVEATSLDTGQNAQIRFSIIGGNDHGKFRMDSKTGRISISKPLDYEEKRSYLLTVVARDMGIPPLSSQATVNIAILDSNDNMPVFTQQLYSSEISEDTQIGSTVFEVSAVDTDSGNNGKVQYSLVDGDLLQQFFVNSDSGHLVVTKTLDREMIQQYALKIKAMDNGQPQLSSVTTVNISILDINDNPPQFSQSNFTAVVKQDMPVGWPVFQLTVTDQDIFPNADPFVFEVLYDDSGGTFRLEPNGVLKTNKELSTKLHNTYFIHIRVYDSGVPPLHSETWIVIKVIEESKYPPITYPLDVLVMIYQDHWLGSELGQIIASDMDRYDSFDFHIAPPTPDGLFKVEPQSGVLHAITGLDAGQYVVNVSVSDGKFTSYTTVTVVVQSVWDDVLKHSVSIRLPRISQQQFLMTGMKNITRLLESILLRNVSVISIQPAPRGDLDVLLALTGEADLPTLSDILHSGGYGNMTIPCECQNEATCRQQINIIPDIMLTVANNGTSFVSPSYRHQLYCSCNSGFTGDQCEEVLASTECICPASQVCVPHSSPPGFICQPSQSCLHNHSCHASVTSEVYNIALEEIVGICISIVVMVSFIGLFILYRRHQGIHPRRVKSINKPNCNDDIDVTRYEQQIKHSKLDLTQIPDTFVVSCSDSNIAEQHTLSSGDVYQYCSSFSRENDAQNNALNCDTTTSSTNFIKKSVVFKEEPSSPEEKLITSYGFPTASHSDIHQTLCAEMTS